MNPDPIRELLVKSLSDLSLSRGETKTLKSLLADGADSARRRAIAKTAFSFARELANGADAPRVADWLEAVVDSLLVEPAPTAAGDGCAITEVHFSPGEACRKRIVDLFRTARETADACVFTITDDRITDAIVATHRRGIAVRVVSDNEKAFDPGSDLERLKDAGVPVAVDTSPHHMHHKFAVFDRKIVLSGSYNWTRSAADMNEENVIVSDDARAIAAFQREFDRLWKEFGA